MSNAASDIMLNRETFQSMLKALDITQREFARIYGLHEVTVSRWGEKGREIPSWVSPALWDRIGFAALERRVAALIGSDPTLPSF
jgi:DNA-binding transcriptional regulator YiaG